MKIESLKNSKVKIEMTIEQLLCIAGILDHVRLSTNGNCAQMAVLEFLKELEKFTNTSDYENLDLREIISDSVIITKVIDSDLIASEDFAIDFKF